MNPLSWDCLRMYLSPMNIYVQIGTLYNTDFGLSFEHSELVCVITFQLIGLSLCMFSVWTVVDCYEQVVIGVSVRYFPHSNRRHDGRFKSTTDISRSIDYNPCVNPLSIYISSLTVCASMWSVCISRIPSLRIHASTLTFAFDSQWSVGVCG